jgi:urease accessory protein
MSEEITKYEYKYNLQLNLKCDRASQQTICYHQYATYPLRLSPVFRLEGVNSSRAYLYIMNTSPGLLAGDELNLSVHLAANTNFYLSDQSATKVHPMPQIATKAVINYQIEVDAGATWEFVPEPIILYTDSALEQNMQIKVHPTAKLFLSEIILPGRLARGESYQFRYYFNRLQVTDLTGKLLFTDAMRLEGKLNPFNNNPLFVSLQIIGNAIAILPDVDLKLLSTSLESIPAANSPQLTVATSILPHNQGLVIRALANKTIELKNYFRSALNCIRTVTHQSPLPYIPK